VILTHGKAGEYGHPGHIQAHQAIIGALLDFEGDPPTVYSPAYLSRETGKFSPEPDILLDVLKYKDKKISAACCHRSQHDLFIRSGSARAGKKISVPEMIRVKEALCLIVPGFTEVNDSFKRILSGISLPLDVPEE
jgi:LmbE family N-acetylglucosaminyl deacetylase